MLAEERRREILARLERDGRLVGSELVVSLGVSEDTVRRDLRDLADQGLLKRVHGGALAAAVSAPFVQRLELALEEKAAIASAALPLIEDAAVIVFDGGTTALALARRLAPSYVGTIVTNSLPIAAALACHPLAEVVLVGGRLLKNAQVVVGSAAVESLRLVHAEVCVLGVCSFHPDVGVTANGSQEADVKRAMVACSETVIALATADKLRSAGPWVVAGLDRVDHLVTDGDESLTRAYASAGIDVVAV